MILRGDSRIIRLSESFPCGIISGDTICGKPATVAYVDPAGTLLTGGEWIFLPVCIDCAKAMQVVYQPEGVTR